MQPQQNDIEWKDEITPTGEDLTITPLSNAGGHMEDVKSHDY